MRKVPFVIGEYFHIFNRGVDKRDIFTDKYDALRFIQSLKEFNCVEPGNDIFIINRNKNKEERVRWVPTSSVPNDKSKKLVNIICYCLNPNHFHLILEELVEGGISEFMKRLGGYTLYYNERYKRRGVLFQGRFKAVHIETNEQLLHVSAYVDLNNKVHKKFDRSKKHFLDFISTSSSWGESIGNIGRGICKKDIILSQFKDKKDYKKFAEKTIKEIKEKRYED